MAVKVSVIMPVYNAEAYLEKSITSVLNQSLKDIELICINDASTDNSLNILKEFSQKDNRLKVYDIPKSGQGAARNLGIQKSNGIFIGFIDADDWINDTMYEKLFEAADNNNTDLAMCYTLPYDSKSLNHIKNYIFDIELQVFGNDIEPQFLDSTKILNNIEFISLVIWNKIYRKELINKLQIRFNTSLPIFEDIYFSYKLLLNVKSLAIVKQRLYNYLSYKNDSLMNALNINKFRAIIELLISLEKNIEEELKDPLIALKFDKFKLNQISYWLNYNFYKKKTSASETKQFFCKVSLYLRKIKKPYIQNLSNNVETYLIIHNFYTIFRYKVTYDKIKKNLINRRPFINKDMSQYKYPQSKNWLGLKNLLVKKDALVLVTDQNYLEYTKQVIYTSYSKGKWQGDYVLIVYNIPDEKLEWFKKRYIYILDFEKIINEKINNWPPVIIQKLYLLHPYMKKWRKLIYLDTDISILKDINDLKKYKGFAAHADFDKFTLRHQLLNSSEASTEGKKLFKELEKMYDLELPAFNVGVMVINTGNNSYELFNKGLDLLFRYKNIIRFPEQAIFNLMFYKSWTDLPYYYNTYTNFLTFEDARKENLLKNKDIRILHFFGNNKPWESTNYFNPFWYNNYLEAEHFPEFIEINGYKDKFSKRITVFLKKYFRKKILSRLNRND